MAGYWEKTNKGFAQRECNGVVYLTVPSFDALGFVQHGFSTRIGGVSRGCFASLNLSLKREHEIENVTENFRRMGQAIGAEIDSMVLCNYEHGTNVECVGREHLGMGILRENMLPKCDGVMTEERDVACVTIHADCNPIFFADRQGRAIGVCHAGWRGTYGNILQTILQKLRDSYGVAPEDTLFGIGPSIGPCCFEVQEDVGGMFAGRYGEAVRAFREGRQYVNLWHVLAMQLEALGIPAENVTFAQQCTACEGELFFSHRRDHGQTGAMGSFIRFS